MIVYNLHWLSKVRCWQQCFVSLDFMELRGFYSLTSSLDYHALAQEWWLFNVFFRLKPLSHNDDSTISFLDNACKHMNAYCSLTSLRTKRASADDNSYRLFWTTQERAGNDSLASFLDNAPESRHASQFNVSADVRASADTHIRSSEISCQSVGHWLK